ERQWKLTAAQRYVFAIVFSQAAGQRPIIDIDCPARARVDGSGRRAVLTRQEKSECICRRGKVIGSVAAMLGMKERKFRKREDPILVPGGRQRFVQLGERLVGFILEQLIETQIEKLPAG